MYRFGPFVLDPERFELRREGAPVEAQPKAFDLILYLVRHRDRVVPREELLRELWRDTAVTEASLAKAVRIARRALDDDAREPRRIQTLRRRGLRFIEPVVESLARGEPEAAGANAFVGREAALSAIAGALASARRGEGRLVLLEGEAGMGKTRTAGEAVRQAEDEGMRALVGWCPEREPTPTLFPFVEALRAWRETAPAEDLSGLDELAPLVDGSLAPSTAPLSPDAGRARLVEGVGRWIERAARSSPLLIVLDDVHRADGTSIAALDRVSHVLGARPIALIATFRPDELPGESPIHALARRPEAVRVTLEGLSLDEVARLVGNTRGGAPTPEAVARIHEASGGNPFFAKELARTASAHADGEADFSTPLPPAIRHVLREAREKLPEEVQTLLVHAAVAGPEVDPGCLARALGRDLRQVVAELDSAAEAGRLVRRDGRFAFAHELVRRAIVEDLSTRTLAAAHRRVGEALAGRLRDGSDPAAVRAAHHLCRGAADGGAARAVALAVEAGELALGRYAHEEAAELLAIAAEALGWLDTPDPALELRLQLTLGDARVVVGERARGRQALRRALALARALGDREAIGRTALAFGGLELSSDVMADPELVAFLEEVLRDLSEAQSGLRVRIAVRLSIAYALAGRTIPDEHVRWIDRAAHGADDPVIRVHALYGRRSLLSRTRDLATRLAEGDRMLAAAEEAASLELELAARSCRFLDRLELGRIVEADLELEAYAALANVVGVGRYPYRVGLYRAARATLDGRLAAAERLAGEAFEHGRRIGARDAWNARFGVLFIVRREQARYDELLQPTESLPEPAPSVPLVGVFRASLMVDAGRRDEARAGLPGMADLLEGPGGPPHLRIAALALAAETAAELGLAEVAAKLLPELEPLAGRVVVAGAGVATFGAIDRPIGRLAAMLGDLDGALARLDAARSLEAAIRARPWLGWTELARARVLRRRGRSGDRGEAERALAAAAEIARDPEFARLRASLEADREARPIPRTGNGSR